MRPVIKLLLLSSILILSCKNKNINEKEPNNNPHTPQVLKGNITVNCTIKDHYDNDYFKIVPDAQPLLRIAVVPDPGLDPAIIVYSANHKLIQTVNYYEKGFAEVIYNFKIQQPFILIKIYNTTTEPTNGAYSLELKKLDPVHNEAEPDNTIKTASPLCANESVAGFYPPGPDISNKPPEKDYFKLEIKENGLWNVKLSLEPDRDFDPSIAAYDIKGSLLQQINNHKYNKAEFIKNIVLEGPGELYIKIQGSNRSDSHVNYYLINEVTAASANAEKEPNDQLHQATSFPGESDEIKGNINYAGDRDIYRISTAFSRGKLLNLVLHPPQQVKCSLTLFNNIGKKITATAVTGSSGLYSINNIQVFKNVYYIAVSSASNSYNENDNYILKKYFRNIVPGLEQEPNNSFSEVQPVKNSKLYTGYLANNTDRDFYEFNIYTDGTYTLELNPVPGMSIAARIFDQREELFYKNTFYGTNKYIQEDINFQKGTYFLCFSPQTNALIKPDTPYRFKIEPR